MDLNNTPFDLYTLVHYFISLILFLLIFITIRLIDMRTIGRTKHFEIPARRVSMSSIPQARDRKALMFHSFMAFIITIILGVIWELVENTDIIAGINISPFTSIETLENSLSDIVFDVLGAMTGLVISFYIINKGKSSEVSR